MGLFCGVFSQTILPIGLQGVTTENYVYSRQYLDATTTSNNNTKQVQSVTYFDGLGRPKQNIAIKASTGGNDIATPVEYDDFGRQTKDYLPLPQPNSSTNGGAIFNAPSSVAYPSGEVVFSQKKLENSPLDRIEEQIQTGSAWSSKPVTFSYETNGLEVKKYTTSFNYTTFHSSLPAISSYAAGTLYKNKIKDEDGNTTIEYKNGAGQTILVRKIAGSTISQGIAPTDNNIYVDTYYVYNDYNQLAFVISPLASRKATLIQADLDNLCYQYRYDGKNRLVEKKLPGKEWEHLLYDKQDRLVGTQDGLMRLANQWMFTKYDQFKRVVYTGVQIDSRTRVTLQNLIDTNTTNPQNNESRSTSPFAGSGLSVYYTNVAFPVITTTTKLLSVNYYDTYPGAGEPFDNILGQSPAPALLTATYTTYGNTVRSLKGLLTASFINNIEANGWTRNYTFYDLKAKPFATYSFNYLTGYTKTESKLDFAGIPEKTFTFHKRLNTDNEIQIKEKFEYNQYTNALVKHYHEVVGKSPEELLSENDYNELGQLTNKKVGNNIQEMDYAYNIRGWMTKINDPANMGAKLFAYEIKYHNPDPTSPVVGKFNGNIAEIDWVFKDIPKKRYSYQYDGLNRLLNGIYSDPDAGISYNINGESIEYDLNGNFTHLYRNTKHGKNYTPIQIDNLTYNYVNGTGNSNRLQSITDASNNSLGYLGGGQTITYDLNGNMTTMPDKGITQSIVYNFLNLPTQIKQNANTTNYIYRADGVKLKKIYNLVNQLGSKIINTEYLDGFQYSTPNIEPIRKALEEKDDTTVSATKAGNEEAFLPLEDRLIAPGNPNEIASILSFFPTAEGYYDYENFRYIYQYKDHLGNVRVSFVKNSAGNLQVMDTNDYYPFGLSFMKPFGQSSVYDPMAIPYNYKYNGKELQETGMYDYGARFYMPDIGRWGVIDPLAEQTKDPYGYVWNNPIKFIDPDGRSGTSTHTDKNGNVVAVYNDGDLGVYRHNGNAKETKQELKQNYSKENTSGGGDRMGITLAWNSFTHFDGDGTPAGKINFGSYQARDWLNNFSDVISEDVDENGGWIARMNYAVNAGGGDKYDYKTQNGGGLYAGSQISEGVYVSARDVGNFAAGRAASITGQSKMDFMLNAGGFNLSGNSKMGLIFRSSHWKSEAQKTGFPTYGEDFNSNLFQRLGYDNTTTIKGFVKRSKIIWGSK